MNRGREHSQQLLRESLAGKKSAGRRGTAKKPDANALADIESKVKNDVESAVVALVAAAGATADPFPRVT